MTDNKFIIPMVRLMGVRYTNVRAEYARYDNSPAIQLFWTDPDAGYEEPLATATVRLETPPAEGCVWIKDYSENEGMLESLVRAGIVEITGRTQRSGWVDIPEARLL